MLANSCQLVRINQVVAKFCQRCITLASVPLVLGVSMPANAGDPETVDLKVLDYCDETQCSIGYMAPTYVCLGFQTSSNRIETISNGEHSKCPEYYELSRTPAVLNEIGIQDIVITGELICEYDYSVTLVEFTVQTMVLPYVRIPAGGSLNNKVNGQVTSCSDSFGAISNNSLRCAEPSLTKSSSFGASIVRGQNTQDDCSAMAKLEVEAEMDGSWAIRIDDGDNGSRYTCVVGAHLSHSSQERTFTRARTNATVESYAEFSFSIGGATISVPIGGGSSDLDVSGAYDERVVVTRNKSHNAGEVLTETFTGVVTVDSEVQQSVDGGLDDWAKAQISAIAKVKKSNAADLITWSAN